LSPAAADLARKILNEDRSRLAVRPVGETEVASADCAGHAVVVIGHPVAQLKSRRGNERHLEWICRVHIDRQVGDFKVPVIARRGDDDIVEALRHRQPIAGFPGKVPVDTVALGGAGEDPVVERDAELLRHIAAIPGIAAGQSSEQQSGDDKPDDFSGTTDHAPAVIAGLPCICHRCLAVRSG
jgi:hypothetical protein